MSSLLSFKMESTSNRLRCTVCGATATAPCQCGVPYELLRPRAAAEIGIKEAPHLSDSVIARQMGISHDTVRRTRQQVTQNASPVERIGLDGKTYGVTEPKQQFWTPEKDAQMMALHKEGKGDKEISEVLGITVGAASGRKHRLMNLRPDLESRLLPPEMPDDILLQATLLLSAASARMHEVDALSTYVDQMHEDVRQLIARDVEVVYNLSRDIIKRLVGGTRNIRPPACGTDIKLRKED
jgi:hypothetical protein